jgi:hypothetical protein
MLTPDNVLPSGDRGWGPESGQASEYRILFLVSILFGFSHPQFLIYFALSPFRDFVQKLAYSLTKPSASARYPPSR